MAALDGKSIIVIGAGVFGLCTALRLARAGAALTVFDPSPPLRTASGVAAGMLAPAGEALFDGEAAGPLSMLRAARDLWPAFAAMVPDLCLDRSGAIFSRDPTLAARAEALGINLSRRSEGLFTDEDWRLDPAAALTALRQALAGEGAALKAAPAPEDIRADAVVVAAGIGSSGLAGLAPEAVRLEPIKGQLLRFAGGPREGPILRDEDGYLVPHPDGAMVGATMEPGRADHEPTDTARQSLLALAARLHPGLEALEHRVSVGVRAAAPDALPLAGSSSHPGVFLATGARRNGWLLAPLVSGVVAAYLTGEDPGPFAASFDPRRFAAG